MAEPGKITNTATVNTQGGKSQVVSENMAAYGRRIRMNRAEHLVNKTIESSFAKHPLYSQDGKGGEADILVKYFNPYGAGRWYVLEASPIDGGKDYDLYGIVDMGQGQEYGYFRLSDLQGYVYKLRNGYPVGGIERDMYFGKKKVKDIKKD